MFGFLKRRLRTHPKLIDEGGKAARGGVKVRDAVEPGKPIERKAEFHALAFKSSFAAFEYACTYFDNKIEKNKALVAIVLDPRKEFGTLDVFRKNKDGTFIAALRVVSDRGGFVTIATVPSPKADLTPGDLVYGVPKAYSRELAKGLMFQEAGWVGFVVAKLSTSLDINDGFEILEQYA